MSLNNEQRRRAEVPRRHHQQHRLEHVQAARNPARPLPRQHVWFRVVDHAMTNNACGSCNACCKAFTIPDLKKAGEWCRHCDIGKACRIYETRPEPCVTFECLWLASQKRDSIKERMAPDMRPDKCKVMFCASTNPKVISAVPTHGANFESGRVRTLIDTLVKSGMAVVIGRHTDKRHILHSPLGVIDVEMTEPDEKGMRWNKTRFNY